MVKYNSSYIIKKAQDPFQWTDPTNREDQPAMMKHELKKPNQNYRHKWPIDLEFQTNQKKLILNSIPRPKIQFNLTLSNVDPLSEELQKKVQYMIKLSNSLLTRRGKKLRSWEIEMKKKYK